MGSVSSDHRGRLARIDDRTFARLWASRKIWPEDIARACGVRRSAVSERAHRMGLPSREKMRRRKLDFDVVREMWEAGVRVRDIAELHGASRGVVWRAVARMGLAKRPRGFRPIGLREYRELKLAEAMAAERRRR